MTKTLRVTLNELDPDQKIKVGSKEANSFWYIGTAGDMLKNLQFYNAYCKAYIESCRRKAENRLKNAIDSYPTIANYTRIELQESKPNPTPAGYIDMLNQWFGSILHLEELLRRKERIDNCYVSISRREVVDIGMSDDASDPGVMRIIINGYEAGKFWTYKDAQKVPSCSFANSKEGEEECD